MITVPKITEEKYRKYLYDRMLFREEQWVIRTNKGDRRFSEIVEDWQKKYIFEPLDSYLHDHHKCPDPIYYEIGGEKLPYCSHPKYNVFYIQLPKKYAKTTVLGGESMTELFFSLSRPGFVGYILAGKKDQAGLLYEEVKGFIDRNSNFEEGVHFLCHKDTIYRLDFELRKTASLTKMSRDAMTTSGIGPDFYIFDEFWNQPDRELWDVVHAGRVAKPNSRGIILSNAGFDTDTICYEVRETCRKKTHKNYYYCEPGISPKIIPKPKWIDKKAIQEDKIDMPPNVFQRWHLNKWTSKYGSAFPRDKVFKCVNKVAKRQFGGRGNYVLAIDAGARRAKTVAIVAHREGKVKVDAVESWQGTKDEAVMFAEIGEWIEIQCQNFNETTVFADPWQMIFLIQILRQKGIHVEEFPFQGSESNIVRLSNSLRDAIVYGYLEFYPEATDLKNDLLKAEMEQRHYGWRLSRKFDFAITLGMACVYLLSNVDEEGDSFDYPLTHTGEKRKFGDLEDLDFSDWKKKTDIETEDEAGIPYWRSFE